MGKIRLNLVSGAVVEKPLINAFKANNTSYVVLDNEMNGSMGLPIILVCKFENNKLIKILDQNEWSIVKEYLKNIIAGNQIEFISVPQEISADDIYYTQLTLPVPSFDALKSAYKVEETVNNANNEIMNMFNPESVVEPTPIVENPVPVMEQPEVNQNGPMMNMESSVIEMPVNPVMSEPAPVVEPAFPNIEQQVVSPMDIVPPIVNEPEITPVIEPTIPQVSEPTTETVVTDSIFREQKEAFMQACENMFDALVQKFERELENHK